MPTLPPEVVTCRYSGQVEGVGLLPPRAHIVRLVFVGRVAVQFAESQEVGPPPS